jgi:hypothetical protein
MRRAVANPRLWAISSSLTLVPSGQQKYFFCV